MKRFFIFLLVMSLMLFANINAFSLEGVEGDLYAWGNNYEGQLGDGTTDDKSSLTLIDDSRDWKSISAGFYHTVAIDQEGDLYAWGDNYYDQLGDGTAEDKTSPTLIDDSRDWKSISASRWHTVAIDQEGDLYAWGDNDYGQLGDGTTDYKTSPTLIDDSRDWKSISTGAYHTVAIDQEGYLYAWGFNNHGQVGDGTIDNKTSPTLIDDSLDWESIIAGEYHTVAIDQEGDLYAWGYNYDGQLGDGTTDDKTSPNLIDDSRDWSTISAGYAHTVAIDQEGDLYAWGDNYYGQLGDGTIDNKTSPTLIDDSLDWKSISAGYAHTVAIDQEGDLYAWGENHSGQLGDGTTDNKTSPTLIDDSRDWESISAGFYHTVAIANSSVNHVPVAVDDTYTTDEDIVLTLGAPGVLNNDSDVDGDPLTVILESDVDNGTLILNEDGSFEYSPDKGFTGSDSFTYVISDDYVNSNIATVTINVIGKMIKKIDISYEGQGDTVLVGSTTQLIVSVKPANATLDEVTWTILSGTELATLDENGILLAEASGEVTIAATAIDGSDVEGIMVINIIEPINDIGIISSTGEYTINVKERIQMIAIAYPSLEELDEVVWSVTNGLDGGKAKITKKNVLRGLSIGTVTVNATYISSDGTEFVNSIEIVIK